MYTTPGLCAYSGFMTNCPGQARLGAVFQETRRKPLDRWMLRDTDASGRPRGEAAVFCIDFKRTVLDS